MRLVALGVVLISPLFAIASWVQVAYKEPRSLGAAIGWTAIAVIFLGILVFG